MNPITISVAELKPALTGLGKVLGKRVALPVLGCVRIERTREGRVELTGTDLDRSATVRFDIHDQGEPFTLLVPHEDLANVAKGCGRDHAIIITKIEKQKAAIRFPVGGQMLEHRCESLPVEEFPSLMEVTGEGTALDPAVRQSIHDAIACASTDETRLILNGAYLDVSKRDAHYVVGTDGRHLFSANSFKLPLGESLIVPSHPFVGWKGFNEDGDWRLRVKAAKKDEAAVIEIASDHWRYISRSHEGNFPNWRQVVPNITPNAVVEIASEEAQNVIQTIGRIPDHDSIHHALGIEVKDGRARLLGKSSKEEEWTHIELPGAKANGGNVTVLLNRLLLLKALRFGLTRIELFDALGPMRFSAGGRQMIVMSIRADAPPAPTKPNPPPASPPAAANVNPPPTSLPVEQPQEDATMPETNGNTTRGSATRSASTTTATADRTALDTTLEKLETIKGSYRDAIRGLNELGDLLKQVQRDNRANEKEISSVRQTIRSLQSVRI